MKLLVALIVAALAATGCAASTSAGDGDPVPSASAEAPSPTPSPGASAEAPTTAASPTERVLPDTAGDDPVKAIEEIINYRWYLLENPRPSDVTLIYAKRCECYEPLHSRVSQLKTDGLHIEGPPPSITEIQLLSREGALARVSYTVALSQFQILDDESNVMGSSDGTAPRRQEATLLKDGPRWRVQIIRGGEA